MAKRNLKTALGASLHQEEKAVEDRFAKAEAYFSEPEAPKKKTFPPAAERPKVVRDTFTMPPDDYALIAAIRAKSVEAGRPANKSEIIRAGLHALSTLPPAKLAQLLTGLEKVKTGRPKQ